MCSGNKVWTFAAVYDVLFCSNHYVDNEVYAWGNNSMGQCGQGNSTGPITKPKKVVGLDGVAIQQISAGTSHSLAWTALPRDRYHLQIFKQMDRPPTNDDLQFLDRLFFC